MHFPSMGLHKAPTTTTKTKMQISNLPYLRKASTILFHCIQQFHDDAGQRAVVGESRGNREESS